MEVVKMTITKVERLSDGTWTANASINGTTRSFHNRYGSWQTDRRPRVDADWPPHVQRREALPRVAAALQAKLPAVERKAKR